MMESLYEIRKDPVYAILALFACFSQGKVKRMSRYAMHISARNLSSKMCFWLVLDITFGI